MRKFVTTLLTLLCIASMATFTLSAQSKGKVATAMQQSIDRLNSQIAEYERQITSIRKDKKSAQAEVNKLSRLIGKRRKLVGEVNSQMNALNGNINQLTRQIDELSKQRTTLQEEYAEMVRVAYRNYRQQNYHNMKKKSKLEKCLEKRKLTIKLETMYTMKHLVQGV